MGGNDLDTLPFEFGCDFGGSFEDKYLVPPLSARMAALSHESGGFDILPPLSASLLSPSTDFQLSNMPSPSPSLFLHCDHERMKSAANRGGHHTLKRKSDAAFPIEVPTLCAKPFKNERPLSSSSSLPVDDEPSESNPSFPSSGLASSTKSTHIGRWTKREHELFLEGLKLYGKSWKKISSLVITRTLVQIRTHAQKYLQKQSKTALKAANAAAAAADAASTGDNDGSNKVDRQPQRFGQHLGDHFDANWMGKGHNGLVPISFPDLLQAPSSSSSGLASSHPSMLSRSSSPYILPALVKKEPSSSSSKLDQLLQDEPHYLSSSMDANGYYQSPMGTDEEILQHPMYAQWSRANPHDTTAAASAYLPTKRRRLEHLMPAPSSHHHQQQHHHLVNPMEAMAASSSDAQQMSLYGLGPPHVFGSMNFNHHQQQQLHPSFTSGSSQFVDSSDYGAVNYGNWQFP